MAESSLDHELAEGILGENYLRINSELGDVNPELDDNSEENIKRIIDMGNSWWNVFEDRTLRLLSND